METPKIKILLLGPPLILVDDQLARVSRKQHRGVLYYLASQSQPVPRAELCNLFWPNKSENLARKNLREALSRLKNDLGVHEFIYSIDDQIMLDNSLVYSDKREFEEIVLPLLHSTAMNTGSSLPDWMVLELKRVMDICRTPWFLQGVDLSGSPGFENWKEETNHWYWVVRSKIIDRLVDHFISSGDLENALAWIKIGLDSDQMNSELNYLMLSCLRDLGKFQQMIDEINFLERYYIKNGEMLPQQFIELRSMAENSKISPDYAAMQSWSESAEGEMGFYGRKNELERLNLALHKKGIILLRGESGSGKSRLIKEFYCQQAYPLRIFYLRPHPLSMRVPFQALCEVMDREITKDEMGLLPLRDQEKISTFYHNQLQGMKPPNLPMSTEGWLPLLQDIFNIFVNIMENAAKKRPVLFVIDDAQWIDLASLSVVNYLVKNNYFRKSGLLIIAKRLEDKNLPLYQSNLRLLKQRKMEVITLPCFSKNETSEFIQKALGKPVDSDLAEWVFQKTGGNPFFLTEYLRILHIHFYKRSAYFNRNAVPIPEPIQAMVEDKLEAMDPESLSILQAAAVLGARFAPDELVKTAGLEIEPTINALERLTTEGILMENPELNSVEGYGFCHEIERDVIVSELSPARRQYLHLRAAKGVLECRGQQPEITPILADHFEKAAEPEQAVSYWLAAGRYYRSVYRKEETISAYERAASLITNNPFLFSVELIHRVFTEWGDYSYDISDARYCEKISNNCLEIGQLRIDALLIGTGLSGLGRAAGMRMEVEKAQEYFQRALFHLRRSGNFAELSEIYARIGVVWFVSKQYLKAKEAFEEGLRIAENARADQGVLETLINNLSQLCILLVYTGEPRKAHEYALEMVNYSRGVSRRSALVQAYSILAMTHYFCGLFGEAIKVGQEVVVLAAKLQMRFWQSFIDITLGQSYLMTGNLDKAWLYMTRVQNREEGFAIDGLYNQALLGIGLLYQLAGEYDKAVATFKDLADSAGRNFSAYESRYFLGITLETLGKTKEALGYIDQAIDMAARDGLRTIEMSARVLRTMITHQTLTAEEFMQQAHPLNEQMDSMGYFNGIFLSKWSMAVAAEKAGDTALAVERYQELAVYCREIESPFLELIPLQMIVSFTKPSSTEAVLAVEQTNQRINEIYQKATTPPVRGFVKKLRIKIRKIGNILSTG